MSAHERGTQDISHHKETYKLIMDVTIWSAGLIGVSILFFTMVFGAGIAWFPSLVVSLVAIILVGMLLKRGAAWHGTMVALAVFTWIVAMAISFLSGLG